MYAWHDLCCPIEIDRGSNGHNAAKALLRSPGKQSVIDRTLVAANGKGRNLPILYYDFDGADCFSRIAISNSLTAATAAAAARAGVFRWVFITVVAV